MTYYPDLSPCPYFGPEMADKLVAVGWLDEAHPYTRGDVSAPFLDKLFDLLADPWAPMYLLGYAECPWCGDDYDARYNGKSVDVGALNLFVPGEGLLYAMPSLAAHYILAHGYAPPAEFCDAVLRCPPMRSRAYFEAIVANGPGRFAASAPATFERGVSMLQICFTNPANGRSLFCAVEHLHALEPSPPVSNKPLDGYPLS